MPKAASEEVYQALEDVRDAARAVLALPVLSAELVNALHLLVARAGKAASTVLLALPREELARVRSRTSGARPRSGRLRGRKPRKAPRKRGYR